MADRWFDIEFEDSIVVPCGPVEAFTIADMATLADWNPAVARSELVSGERLVVGARYRCTVARGPIRLSATPVLVEVVRDELVRYSGNFGGGQSEDSIRFTSEGAGTRLTFRNRSTLPRWARPMRRFINWSFRRQAGRAIDGAARYLAPTGNPT